MCRKQIPERSLGKSEMNPELEAVIILISFQSCSFYIFLLSLIAYVFHSFTKLLWGPRIAISKNRNIVLILQTNIQYY